MNDFAALKPMRDYHLADWKYEKIMEEIRTFEKELDDDSVKTSIFWFFYHNDCYFYWLSKS